MSVSTADFQPGDGVVYRPYPGGPAEDGTVVRTNEHYVFVLYAGDREPKSTLPGDLTHLRGPEDGER